MNYMGGKHRQGPIIAGFVHRVIKPEQWYVEPFCGALGVACRVQHPRTILSDISTPLITMWRTLQDPRIELPDVVTEEEYNRVKVERNPYDWRTAYYGFGMSFGAKYWGGYARNKRGTYNFAATLKRSTNRKRSTNLMRSTTTIFYNMSYLNLNLPPRSVIYCDPPYAGRSKVHDCGPFNHELFWAWCRNAVQEGHVVLVTEFSVPEDFCILHNFGDTVVRHYASRGADGTQEVLVCHESQIGLFT